MLLHVGCQHMTEDPSWKANWSIRKRHSVQQNGSCLSWPALLEYEKTTARCTRILFLSNSQPCFASHTQKSQIWTASVLPPLKYPHLVLSFLGIKIIPTNVRQSRQIIHLKGLSPIWLGLWVCYSGIKIQKMSYTPLLFAVLLIFLKPPEAS